MREIKYKKISIWLANLISVLHLIFGLFLMIGWQYSEVKIVYLTCLIMWIGSWIILGYCPLTKWEFMLRNKYGSKIDPDTEIIQYYFHKCFKIRLRTEIIFILGILLFFILFYLGIKD